MKYPNPKTNEKRKQIAREYCEQQKTGTARLDKEVLYDLAEKHCLSLVMVRKAINSFTRTTRVWSDR